MAQEGIISQRERGLQLLEQGEMESKWPVHIASDKYEEAIMCFDEVLSMEPTDSISLRGKAASLRGNERHEEALACIDEALNMEPKNARILLEKGRILAQSTGRREEALACLDEALELEPDNADIWYEKAGILGWLPGGKEEEALKCYDKVLDLDPGNAEALYLKCRILSGLNRHAEALEYSDIMCKRHPDDPRGSAGRGFALNYLGMYAEALECLDDALKRWPDDAGAQVARIRALSGLGRHAEALEYVNGMPELDKDIALLMEKARVLESMGRNEDAGRCHDEVYDLMEGNIQGWDEGDQPEKF